MRPKAPGMMPKAPVEFTDERKEIYIRAIEDTGYQTLSAREAGVTVHTVRNHVNSDPEFKRRVQEALDAHTENYYVREAQRRALEGVTKPIIGGKDRDTVVAHVQEYSDSLLHTLLKSRRPEFNKGAEEGGGAGGGGALGGSGGGVLIVMQAPHSIEDWEKLFGEKAKGTTGRGATP